MKLTKTEWQVMTALWDKHPATARQIGERLPATVNWAYTTIKTILTRLLEKGAVTEVKEGNTSVYEPAVSRACARKNALRDLADQAFNGAFGPLLHFLVEDQELTATQRDELIEALKADKAGGGEKGGSK